MKKNPIASELYNASYRPIAQDGDVAVARDTPALLDIAIEKLGDMPGHHAGFVYRIGNNLMVAEAMSAGITTGLLSQWLDRDYGAIDIYRLKPEYLKAFDPSAALDSACAAMRAIPYNVKGLGDMFALRVLGLDQGEETDQDSPTSLFCSAFTAYCRRHGGVDEFGKPDRKVAPGDYAFSPCSELIVSFPGHDPKKEEDHSVGVTS